MNKINLIVLAIVFGTLLMMPSQAKSHAIRDTENNSEEEEESIKNLSTGNKDLDEKIEASYNKLSNMYDELTSEKKRDEIVESVDEGVDTAKSKISSFIDKASTFMKKINPKKFYEDKVKTNKYYKLFFGNKDDE